MHRIQTHYKRVGMGPRCESSKSTDTQQNRESCWFCFANTPESLMTTSRLADGICVYRFAIKVMAAIHGECEREMPLIVTFLTGGLWETGGDGERAAT